MVGAQRNHSGLSPDSQRFHTATTREIAHGTDHSLQPQIQHAQPEEGPRAGRPPAWPGVGSTFCPSEDIVELTGEACDFDGRDRDDQVDSEITKFPDFEHLEAAGRGKE